MTEIQHIPECADCPVLDRTLFHGCPAEELCALTGIKTYLAAESGTRIFEQGSSVRGIFCLYSGSVALCGAGRFCTEQILHVASPGESLGLPDIFLPVYTKSAIAQEDSRLCFIPLDAIISLWKNSPTFRLNAIQRLTLRLNQMDN